MKKRKIFRKNQMIITALALMIAVAGYVSYTRSNTADETVETADTYEISDEDSLAEIFTDTEDDGEEDAVASADTSDSEDVLGDAVASTDAADTDAQAASTDVADTNTTDSDAQAASTDASSDSTEATGTESAGETVLTSADASVDFAAEVKLEREQVRSKNKETLMDIVNSTAISDAQKQDAVDAMVEMTDIAERENAAELLLEAKGFTDVVVSITDDTADVVLNMGDVTDAKRAQVEDIVKRKTGIDGENIVITPLSE